MGRCLQVVHTFKQNITGTNPETLAAGTSDSLSVPNFEAGTQGHLLEAWAGVSAHAADFQLRSPNFHDNNRGIRMAYQFDPTLSGADGDPQFLLPYYVKQRLYRSDTLIVETIGTATDNVALDLLMYFDNLEGADQRLESWAAIEGRITDMVGIKVAATAGATGNYGSNRTLNQDDDRLIANQDYAILGATGQLACGLLAFTAPETSGRRIGLPLHWDGQKSAGFFVDLSTKYNLPLIPVINSNNKGNVIFQAADAAAGVATAATIIMAQLA